MKKIVIKISSNLLNPDNKIDIIEKLSKEIHQLKKKGYKIIIVTSGAVMHGLKTLGFEKKPAFVPLLQSLAAIGQIKLMTRYQNIFNNYNLIPAQILVSTDDFKIRSRYLNLRNTIESLLENEAIPIFNENDSTNIEELKFGDNDHLSSLITIMVDFDILIILTDVNGLYDKDPKINKEAQLISKIEDLTDDYLKYTNSKVSNFSSGGMKSKIKGALKAVKSGKDVFIGNGFNVSLVKIIEKSESGTYIKGNSKKQNARKKWLGSSPTEKGSIKVDEGAYKALKNNSSLLASGITQITGHFNKGSLINILFNNEKIGQGLTNYSSKEIEKKKKKKSTEFNKFLKKSDYKEVIHKNNLILY